MTVQVFHPTPVDQSATNWAVAARIVGAFAPHAQTTPGMTVALDAGALFNGATLTEVPTQSTTAIAAPAANPRIDRVVVDAATGAVSVITGTEAATPAAPAIPYGTLPVARVALSTTTTAITNDLITDERVLLNLTPAAGVACRATLNGVDQAGAAANSWVKINLSATDFNAGNGFDTANHRFKPSVPGYYQVNAQFRVVLSASELAAIAIFKNGTQIDGGQLIAPINSSAMPGISDVIFLNGSTDYLEVYAWHTHAPSTAITGAKESTFFTAVRAG